MKHLINTLIKIALLIVTLLFGSQALMAQSEQLQRDMRIAERILEEIFTPPVTQPRQVAIAGGRTIESRYVPGVGVHFIVNKTGAGSIVIFGSRPESDDREGKTEDWVKNNAMEYFTQYASQLRDLPGNEQVRITYGMRASSPHILINPPAANRSHTEPRKTIWVSKSEIDRFAEGRISESEFRNRISSHSLTTAGEHRDLDIFATVLETALKSGETEHLRISGKPQFDYLPGYGAHYNINLNRGFRFLMRTGLMDIARQIDDMELEDVNIQIDLGRLPDNLSKEIDVQINQMDLNLDSLRLSLQRLEDTLKVRSGDIMFQLEELRSQAEESRRRAEITREQWEANREQWDEARQRFERSREQFARTSQRDTTDLSADFENIISEITSVISDYGTTLRSLSEVEMLMITINWPQRNPTIPEKTHIRISKSDILAGREPVIEHTSVR